MNGCVSPSPSDRVLAEHSLVIWQILDGKPGHRNQVLGLAEALQRRVPVTRMTIEINDRLRGFRSWLPGRLEEAARLAAPDLLIAAGHATHLPLLRLRQRFGGQAIVLMKPSLPKRLFDLCFVPDTHQFARAPANVVLTAGALNRIRPSETLEPDRGLILIGGPSAHYDWLNPHVLDSVASVLQRTPRIGWTIATSRRTPVEFGEQFRRRQLPGTLVEAETTGADWLPEQLRVSGTVWVTADSVSMLYEALTAGAATGVLDLPGPKATRVVRAVEELAASRRITRLADWQTDAAMTRQSLPLCEADRCAALLLDRMRAQHQHRAA